MPTGDVGIYPGDNQWLVNFIKETDSSSRLRDRFVGRVFASNVITQTEEQATAGDLLEAVSLLSVFGRSFIKNVGAEDVVFSIGGFGGTRMPPGITFSVPRQTIALVLQKAYENGWSLEEVDVDEFMSTGEAYGFPGLI